MAKLVYIGFPSPLSKATCVCLDTNEEQEVIQVARGICQDISVVPEKKGKYKIELEFEYDPSVLSNISNISISGNQNQTVQQEVTSDPAVQTFDLNMPGLEMKPNEDGSISFRIKKEDGTTTEVNADIPGMSVVKNEDGTVSFSMPQGAPETNTQTTTTTSTKEMPEYSSRSTRTTTTITQTSMPTTETIVTGQLTFPKTQQNINIKLPCPKQHQEDLKTDATGPDGEAIPITCTVVDDEKINLSFSPTGGNGLYSLNLYIADKIFPGCPIQMEVKGL